MSSEYQNPTETQGRYWQFMYELTSHIYYLQQYLLHYQTIERRIKYFLAIISSSAIATWAIWQKHSFVWAFLIAISQVVSAVKHLLPFAQREKNIRVILPELSLLSSKAELGFYKVVNGQITDEEIHAKTVEFKRKKSDIIAKLDENALPENDQFLNESEEKTKIYFQSYYGDQNHG